MDFNKYENTMTYPQKKDFTTAYFYKNGQLIATLQPGEKIINELGGCVRENVCDESALKEARIKYRKHENFIYTLFKEDLFKELGISDNPKREKLFELAWERGHSSGYESVYSEANELVDLIL